MIFWCLLAMTPCCAAVQQSVAGGFLVQAVMALYDNVGVDHNGHWCDWMSNPGYICDPKIFLKLRSKQNPNAWSQAVYPKDGDPSSDFYHDRQKVTLSEFLSSGNFAQIALNASNQTTVVINVRAIDRDWEIDDEIAENSREITIPLVRDYSAVLGIVKTDSGVVMNVQVTVLCFPKTCGKSCFWSNSEVQCVEVQISLETQQLLLPYSRCVGSVFYEHCATVYGNFVLKFAILTTGKQKCERTVKICADLYPERASETDCQIVAEYATHNFEEEVENTLTVTKMSPVIYDYHLEVSELPHSFKLVYYVSSSCPLLTVKRFAESFSFNSVPSNFEVTINNSSSEVFLRGVLKVQCQPGYTGKYCRYACPTSCSKRDALSVPCGKRSSRNFGPNCALEQLCAPEPCKNGGSCFVKRRDLGSQFEVQCACKPGYSGRFCELVNGTPCFQDTCNLRGACVQIFNASEGKIEPKCECWTRFSGSHCEICMAGARSDCDTLAGPYAAVLELESLTNAKGLLSNGKYCDDAQSACDTRVTACLDGDCKLLALAKNQDNVDARLPTPQVSLAFAEFNISQFTRNSSFFVEVVVRDENDVLSESNENLIGKFHKQVKFDVSRSFPQSSTWKWGKDNENLKVKVHFAFRCARGYYDAHCTSKCNNQAPPVYFNWEHTVPSIDSDYCWPQSRYLCADGSIGPSCALKSLCVGLNCSENEQCVMLGSLNGARCATKSRNRCLSGEVLCNRRGKCIFNTESEESKCACDGDYGGELCEIEHWCGSNQLKCSLNGTCVTRTTSSLYKCFCDVEEDGEAGEGEGEERNDLQFCNVLDPCSLRTCRNGGICLYDFVMSATRCECRSGFTGDDCEQERGPVALIVSVTGLSLLVLTFLLGTAAIIVSTVKRYGRISKDNTENRSLTFTRFLNSRKLSSMRQSVEPSESAVLAPNRDFSSIIIKSSYGGNIAMMTVQPHRMFDD